MSIKEKLYLQLKELVDLRVTNAQKAIQAAKAAKSNETKSTAGDKFETGRAMMQAEEDRSNIQLAKALAFQSDLAQVNRFTTSKTAVLGSLVIADSGTYFLSIGAGKIMMDNTTYFAISLASPIGQLLFGKGVGEKISFRGKEIVIQRIG